MAAFESARGAGEGRMEMGYSGMTEDAFRDRRGRRRYDDGRFAPRSEGDARMMDDRFNTDGETESRRRSLAGRYETAGGSSGTYRVESENVIPITRSANRIGFSGEVSNHHGKKGKEDVMRGYGASHGFDKSVAEEWMRNIQNADDSIGAHWPLEHIEKIVKEKDMDMDPMELWVAVNMMYADYYPVAKAMNMNNIGFYMELAKCFLDDEDAVKDKLAAYYHNVVKH